ncbi:MAG TPA: phosphate/phosphite/phosphonate ABC transporter substrate-binding protein [Coriobacteriia bacterium]
MLRHPRTGVTVCLAVAAVLALAACVAPSSPAGTAGTAGSGASSEATLSTSSTGELTVAIAGMVTPDEGLEYYQALSAYVARKAGLRLRLFHKAEYAEVNTMLEQRKVDMAFVCSGPYVTGHDSFGLELLAAPQIGGAPVYYSYIIVPAKSTVSSLEGLRGKTFAFTDPESNTGKTVPTYLVSKMGSTPEAFFSRTFLTYSHDNSIKAVATGAADGAAVDSLIWEYANAHSPQYTSQTKVILKSEPFAVPPVVVPPSLDPALKTRLRDALLHAHEDPEGRAILDKMGIERFVMVEDSAYDSIRAMNAWIAGRK